MTNYESIEFGVDLVKASQAEYDFLLEVQGLECLRNDAVLQNAIRRYESLWLPLVASKTENINLPECFLPPIDIAWVWHCHMLAPHKYAEYCLSLFGNVLDHSVTKSTDAYESTKSTWRLLYPDEPFEVSNDLIDGNILHIQLHQSKSDSFDLLEAIHRQQDFVYNIHLPHYRDTKFLEAAVKRYKKYLFLKKKNPAEFLVPCYDIDLVWHTHQLHPIDYERVTKSLLGRLLIHDDTDSDRNPGSKLSNAYGRTSNLWKNEFEETFATAGAMYRGDSPKGRLYLLTPSDIEHISGRKTVIVINSISITKVNKNDKKDVKLQILRTNLFQQSTLIQTLSGKMGNMTWDNQNLQFSYGPTDKTIDFKLTARKKLFSGKSQTIGEFQERFGQLIYNHELQNGGVFKSEGNMKLKNISSEAKYMVSGSIGRLFRADTILLLEAAGFEADIDLPSNEDELWGPVPLHKSNAENICHVASHSLRRLDGNVIFTCRIIHSVKMMTSVMQIFFQNKMAAVAHVIGTEQLPMKSQISGNLSLNPSEKERAILIKTGEGDSMILVGKWTGFVRGVPGIKGQPGQPANFKLGIRAERGRSGFFGIPGNPGHLEIKVYRINSKHFQREETISIPQYDVLEFEGLTLDFQRGIITCNEMKIDNILHYVSFSFSIALLHVLCVPRPANWKPGESLKPTLEKRGGRTVERFPDEDITFLMAAGLHCLTPSNHYIHNNVNANLCARCASGGITSSSCGIGISQKLNAIDTEKDCNDGKEVENAEYGGSCGGCGGCGGGCGGCLSVIKSDDIGGGRGGNYGGGGGRDTSRSATSSYGSSSYGTSNFEIVHSFHTSCGSSCGCSGGGDHSGCGGFCD